MLNGLQTILSAAVIAGLAAPALASPPSDPYRSAGPAEREGLALGFGIGGGELRCEDISGGGGPCNGITEAGGFHAHAGGMLSPDLALLGELWVMGHTQDSLTVTHTITTAQVQYWLLPRLWLRGGLGVAHARFRYDGLFVTLQNRTQSVPALMAAIGYELIVGRSFALDLQLRGGTGTYRDDDTRAHSTALAVGFNWY